MTANILFFDSPASNFAMSNEVTSRNIFLAGPILGAADWQEQAKQIIRRIADTEYSANDLPIINVWNPRRPEFKALDSDFDDSTFFEQVDWEHEHLECSSNNGVILFWIPNKTIETKRNFALTTMFELGEAIGHLSIHNARQFVAVGIEDGFTNKKYLKYTIEKKTIDCNAAVLDTLEATVRIALSHIYFDWKLQNE